MYTSSQNLGVFVNRWVKIEGATATLPVSEKIQNKEYYQIDVQLNSVGWNRGAIAAYFDPKKWGDALINLRLGSGIRAVCQFEDVQKKQLVQGYDMYLYTFVFYNCEAL
jgi:hypothetical protein